MSYSRWTHSRFYTMWSGHKAADTDKKVDQIFEIVEIGMGQQITYGDMLEDFDAVLEKVKKHYSKEHDANLLKEIPKGGTLADAVYEKTTINPDPLSEADILELRSCMMRFMEGVESDDEYK
jgi:hypothetical protein